MRKRDDLKGRVRMTVTMTVYAPPDADPDDVRNFLYGLEWSGGCRDPLDPMFDSLVVDSANVAVGPT